ncbi:MAG: M23 family metallopeptidase [Clostridiaceae bacterium]|jgi:murein DD-endopeptidase MepM/ murein hydrolase activator NlpD|nr:M23 family metallopeptidase [Clostridiaceae bacterium]
MKRSQKTVKRRGIQRYGTRAVILTLLVLIAAFIIIAVPKPVLKLADIVEITLSDPLGNTSIISDKNSFSLYVDAINSARPINRELAGQNLKTYGLNFTLKNDHKQYKLYVDRALERKSLFVETESGLCKIGAEYFERILSDPIFDTLYEHNRPPRVSLTLDGSSNIILPSDYEWQMRKADGEFYPVKTDYLKGTDYYSFDINQDSVLGYDFEVQPDIFYLFIYRDNDLVMVQSLNQPDNIARLLDEDGLYNCIMQLEWNQDDGRDFYGKATYEFTLAADYPVRIDISAEEIDPGELLVIKASNIQPHEDLSIETEIDFKPNAFQEGNTRTVLLPVSYFHKENRSYSVKVSSGDVVKEFSVFVRPKEFIIQYLRIDPQVAASTRNEKSSIEIREKLYPLKPVSDPVRYWEGEFIQPVEGGRVSPEDFGKRRYVNNSPTSYRHNGLDIGHDEGAPIVATNNGRVLIADFLIETGNTIIIEHGYGLKSWHYHLSELYVKTGDMVKKGDVIGTVGSTGFSTGPHLHFSFTINDVWINPITILEHGVPLTGVED